MSDLLAEIVGTDISSLEKADRLEKAKDDFGFFCRTYLSDYFYEDPAEYQQILYNVANTQSLSASDADKLKAFVNEKYHPLLKPTEKLAGAMFIEPREHGKTVRWSFAYVLWRVLTGRSNYVLLIGASGDAASENLQNIKTEIEENEELLADYGELKGKVWTNTRLELSNGTCIQSKGAGASMRGTRFRQFRPDLIVLDDVLKDDAVDSYTLRNKIYRWLKRVVLNLGKKAFIIWVNTIFHNDDPISRLCRECANGDLKRWIAVRLSCIKPDGTPLWPEYWSIDDLLEKKQTIGIAAFSTEYMNEPLSDEERIIHIEWIESYKYLLNELPPRTELTHFCGVDPATGKHDRTAIVPIAVDKSTGIIYVLPSFAKTCSETMTMRQLVLYYRMYHFNLIGWEDVVFSGIYGNYVQKMAAEEHIYLPIKKLTVGGMSKEARVRSISMLIENGIIRFPEHGAENIIQELTEFPMGAFDDLCDALVHAVNSIEKGNNSIAVSKAAAKHIQSTAKSIINRVRGLR
jgi:predicted phage terminase large subunit-like protein